MLTFVILRFFFNIITFFNVNLFAYYREFFLRKSSILTFIAKFSWNQGRVFLITNHFTVFVL